MLARRLSRHRRPAAWQTRGMSAPETMTAMVIDETGGPERFRATEAPVPSAFIGDVLVRVEAAGVNPIDAKIRSGKSPTAAAIRDWPAVLGHDFSGTVARGPYDAHPLSAGTEVYGMTLLPRYGGSYAEYVAAPVTAVAPRPSTLTPVEAAAVPLAALTAWGAVVDAARVHAGQRVLVHAGAGGVGHLAVQLARFFGAEVVATASQADAGWLRSLGAAEVVDYRETRFDEVLDGLDAVIDLIGNVADDTGSRSLRVLRPGGILVNVPTGSFPGLREEAAAAGVVATDFRLVPDGSVLRTVGRLIDAGDVDVRVHEQLPLGDVAQAHRLIEDGHVHGKVVLEVA